MRFNTEDNNKYVSVKLLQRYSHGIHSFAGYELIPVVKCFQYKSASHKKTMFALKKPRGL